MRRAFEAAAESEGAPPARGCSSSPSQLRLARPGGTTGREGRAPCPASCRPRSRAPHSCSPPSAGSTAAAEPTGDPAFVPPDTELEKVVDGDRHDLVFAEGPVVTCDGQVLWSDVTFTNAEKGPHGGLRAGDIMRYDPRTGAVSVFRSPSGTSNGLRIDPNCNLPAAEGADHGGRRITRTDLTTGRAEIVAGLYQGRPFNAPDDLTIDGKGRI